MVIGRNGRSIYLTVTALFFAALFLLLLNSAMHKDLSHDENMYVAGGRLLSEGLLPYRDYHYFQMPYLALVYAGIYMLTDNLLLGARLFNTVCSTSFLGIVYYIASTLFREGGYAPRFLAGASAVVLVAANPVFVYASGLAWNHDLPLLLTLLAFALFTRGAQRPAPGRWLPVAGALVGCAVGTRLSFAAVLVPFAGGALILPGAAGWRSKVLSLCAFIAGLFVALVPAFVLFVLAPDNFLFDNLRYHAFNEVYWRNLGYTRAMDLPGKLVYARDVALEPGSLVLCASFMVTLVVVVWATRARWAGRFGFLLAVALVPFLLAGALAPTPTWYQYFYVLLPFMALAAVFGAAALYALGGMWRLAVVLPFAAALVCAGYAVPGYEKLNASLSTADWVPVNTHQVGEEIRRAVGSGRVLTLSPLFSLEGGLDIYDELAAGPFGWRMAGLLSADERTRLGMVSPADLDALLRDQPPRAILVGLEPGLESPLIEYAQAHGFTRIKLSNGADLWLAEH